MAAPSKKHEAKDGFTLVKAHGGSISFDGVDYAVADGSAEVPTESLAMFASLGIFPLE